jgi:retron-type reverse transcriptase
MTGTPQGGILSPLLANIALSVPDDYFVEQWRTTMKDHNARYRRRQNRENGQSPRHQRRGHAGEAPSLITGCH